MRGAVEFVVPLVARRNRHRIRVHISLRKAPRRLGPPAAPDRSLKLTISRTAFASPIEIPISVLVSFGVHKFKDGGDGF